MSRVLVITDEVLGRDRAGPALRAQAMATVLSAEHRVALRSTAGCADDPTAATGEPPSHHPIDFGTAQALTRQELERLAIWAEVIVFCGYVLVAHPWLRRSDAVLVADLYDPFHLEVLASRSTHQAETGPVALHHLDSTIDAISDQLGRADFVLCASERQRDLWLGHLGAVGRLNPVNHAHDPTFRALIDVCPFGLSTLPPAANGPGLRGRASGPFAPIGDEDPIVVWGGGVYDWLDPITAIDAVGQLRDEVPGVRLVFLGGAHPTHGSSPALRAAQSHARARGLLGDTVIFNDGWVPYEHRQNHLLDATVAISTHQQHLETRFAFRTRVLDYLWCRLPMVLSEGDELSAQVQAGGAGVAVAPGSVAGTAEALRRFLVDPQAVAAAADGASSLAEEYTWPRALQPLSSFCAEPHRAPDLADPATAAVAARRSRLPGALLGPLSRPGRDASQALRIVRASGRSGPADLLGRVRQRWTQR